MNRGLVAGVLAGLSAIALAGIGATYSDPVGSSPVRDNTVGAGVLQLDLTGGSADARLEFAGLMPGGSDRHLVWVATNDASSTIVGTIAVRFTDLVDVAAPCAVSRGKALGEIASGIAGCTVSGEQVSGTPQQGNLSRVLAVGIDYAAASGGAAGCGPGDGGWSLLADNGPGDLRTLGREDYQLTDGTSPLVLLPGQGVCLSVTARWPATGVPVERADPEHPTDDAAQGDALRVGVRFELTQVIA
jgi:hypothetical protein